MRDLKVGDKVTRMLGGKLAMPMHITKVTEDRIFAVADGAVNLMKDDDFDEHWQFDRDTGIEEDEDLGWGTKYGVTGSFLKRITPTE